MMIAADLAKRYMDEVSYRVRANYSIVIRRRGQYCYVLCPSQNCVPFYIAVRGAIVAIRIELPLWLYQDAQYAI